MMIAMHVRIVLMMCDKVIWKMTLIKVICFTCGRGSWHVIDTLIEMRLIQFKESSSSNCHTTTTAAVVVAIDDVIVARCFGASSGAVFTSFVDSITASFPSVIAGRRCVML
jgi:hypothetical protein